MDYQEQLEILKQGVKAWNEWRTQNPRVPIYLKEVNLSGLNLSNINLSGANLRGSDLSNANLSSANLSGVDFSRADLSNTNLREADLSFAGLNLVTLKGANLKNAELSFVTFREADLSSTAFNGALIMRAIFSNVDLRQAEGLDDILHLGPSTVGIDTLERSQGEISEVFLKKAGVSNTFIEYARSLTTMQTIEYYTCFISYSSKDELFARRLHNDLQEEGIRCWFAPEDMDIGDKIKHRIDESIRLYDKLLLILSEHSIASNWVAYEVERALKKEPQGIPNVLYPVLVDQAILNCTTDWASDIKETRHIGDFEHWTDPQQYEVSFKRLLRALNQKKKP
jgi:TIR domain/Pentapeptide repeats (8 copies)